MFDIESILAFIFVGTIVWITAGICFAQFEILSTPQRNRTRDAWTRVRGTNVQVGIDPLNQQPTLSSAIPAMTSDGPMGFWIIRAGGPRWIGPQQPEPIRDQELQPPLTNGPTFTIVDTGIRIIT